MCGGAICGDDHTTRPWWPTEQRLDVAANHKVFTGCCYRRVPASETICRLRLQEMPCTPDWGDYQDSFPWAPDEPVNWFSYVSYYDSTWQIECNPDGGCKATPRKRLGMHLREPYYA